MPIPAMPMPAIPAIPAIPAMPAILIRYPFNWYCINCELIVTGTLWALLLRAEEEEDDEDDDRPVTALALCPAWLGASSLEWMTPVEFSPGLGLTGIGDGTDPW